MLLWHPRSEGRLEDSVRRRHFGLRLAMGVGGVLWSTSLSPLHPGGVESLHHGRSRDHPVHVGVGWSRVTSSVERERSGGPVGLLRCGPVAVGGRSSPGSQ